MGLLNICEKKTSSDTVVVIFYQIHLNISMNNFIKSALTNSESMFRLVSFDFIWFGLFSISLICNASRVQATTSTPIEKKQQIKAVTMQTSHRKLVNAHARARQIIQIWIFAMRLSETINKTAK